MSLQSLPVYPRQTKTCDSTTVCLYLLAYSWMAHYLTSEASGNVPVRATNRDKCVAGVVNWLRAYQRQLGGEFCLAIY